LIKKNNDNDLIYYFILFSWVKDKNYPGIKKENGAVKGAILDSKFRV
jgi:hypothetical protein